MTATSPTESAETAGTNPAVPARDTYERRIQLRPVIAEEVYPLLGSAAGAIALVWLLYERVLPFTGALGFWLCCYGVFLLLYASVTAMRYKRQVVVDRLAAVAAATAALFAIGVIADQISYITERGWPAITHLNFWTQ